MFNQLLKFTLVSSALLWLRPRWRGLLALGVLVILVHVLHGEFLGYVELSGDRSLLIWSYILKWSILILGVVSYIILGLFGAKLWRSSSKESRIQKISSRQPTASADDGFDFLRHKKRLQSRAEKIISQEKYEEKNR